VFVFSSFGEKSKPPTLKAVVDSITGDIDSNSRKQACKKIPNDCASSRKKKAKAQRR
jgi:hypothetical protein